MSLTEAERDAIVARLLNERNTGRYPLYPSHLYDDLELARQLDLNEPLFNVAATRELLRPYTISLARPTEVSSNGSSGQSCMAVEVHCKQPVADGCPNFTLTLPNVVMGNDGKVLDILSGTGPDCSGTGQNTAAMSAMYGVTPTELDNIRRFRMGEAPDYVKVLFKSHGGVLCPIAMLGTFMPFSCFKHIVYTFADSELGEFMDARRIPQAVDGIVSVERLLYGPSAFESNADLREKVLIPAGRQTT